MESVSAADFLPDRLSLTALREAASSCRGCALYQNATQTVFGEGLKKADLMLVGEQPGDREDRVGAPFVGPAGRLLDEGLAAAGIDRSQAYVTNVVKHFAWTPRGKRRIHRKPNLQEITACRPWLDAELAVVRPRAVVALGATAAQALFGRDVRVTKDRGRPLGRELAPLTAVTVHPSSILRAPDERARSEGFESFVADLAVVAKELASPQS